MLKKNRIIPCWIPCSRGFIGSSPVDRALTEDMRFLYALLVGAFIASAYADDAFSKNEDPLVETKVGAVMGKYVKGLLYSLLAGACIASPIYGDKPDSQTNVPLVKMNVGSVMGKYVKVSDKQVAAFLGIPFATAPIRFAKPQAAKPWERVLRATEKPPQCPQYSLNPNGFTVSDKNSEDCLYLNVWSPSVGNRGYSRKLPVMVWIHGGGFVFGSSSMDVYDGSALASYGDVVVVTLNYRLGVFGFLSSGTEDVLGNAGFYDQVMALQWVRDNIEQFGGDPDSVTLFGESAGSVCVSAHLVSPLSRGLFHRIALMSGAVYEAYRTDTFATAQSKLRNFSEAIGCSGGRVTLQNNMAQVVQCLRDQDVDTLLRAQYEFLSPIQPFFLLYAGGEALPKHPIEAYASGDFAQVEALVGDVKDEGTIFLYSLMPKVFPDDALPSVAFDQVGSILSQTFPKLEGLSVETIEELYFRNVDHTDEIEILRTMAYVFGDFIVNCPVFYAAEKMKSVHFYWDPHRSKKEKRNEWMGSYHSSDVPYVFGIPVGDSSNYTAEDGEFSEDKMLMMSSFARTGNPLSPESKDEWPAFDSKNHLVHVLDSRRQNIQHPRSEFCEFWRPFILNDMQN